MIGGIIRESCEGRGARGEKRRYAVNFAYVPETAAGNNPTLREGWHVATTWHYAPECVIRGNGRGAGMLSPVLIGR